MKKNKTILLLVDRPGWVFDNDAQAIVRHLGHEFNFIIKYVVDKPDLSRDHFDFIYVYFWGETYHRKFVKEPKRIIKGLSSHRWENEEKYGLLSPKEMAAQYLYDAGFVTATSKRLQELVSPYRKITYLPSGFEKKLFNYKRARKGKLVVGWAGNINDPCKGVQDILAPACKGLFDLKIAGGDLALGGMAEFYNSVDIIAVASTAEGEPVTLIEGMACGCFPVCTNVGIVPELVTHNKNGLIIKRTVNSFRTVFDWCNKNIDLVRERGLTNADLMLKTRTWELVAPNFLRFFSGLT